MNLVKKIKNKSGFSFLEMIIAVAIFSIIAVAVVAVFASITKTQENARAVQKNMESAGTAMELMAKTIRMSSNLTAVSDTWINMYNNSQSRCISYRFYDNKLQVAEISSADPNCSTYGSFADLVSDVIGKFDIVETDSSVPQIGKAIISIKAGNDYLQTSVSFMDYQNIIQ